MKFLKVPIIELINFFIFLITFCPGKIGIFLRNVFLKIMFKELGKNFYSEIGLFITGHANITIKNNCRFRRYASINADKNSSIKIGDNISVNYNVNINSCNNGYIEIGSNVFVGQNTVIRASGYKYDNVNVPIKDQGHEGGKIIISSDVWIGANCVIIRNTKIGSHSIIGAGSVVTRDVDANTVVGGNPAKLIKKLNNSH